MVQYQLYFESPVAHPESIEILQIVKRAPIGASYYSEDVFTSLALAQEAKDKVLVEALTRWANDETFSPFWAITPSGKKVILPTWAEVYGFEFYDTEPEADWSHYLGVRRL